LYAQRPEDRILQALVKKTETILAEDMQTEPARVQDFYTVTSHRLEPIGLAYLWPLTG
jgi:hypothetical protein